MFRVPSGTLCRKLVAIPFRDELPSVDCPAQYHGNFMLEFIAIERLLCGARFRLIACMQIDW